MIQLEGGAVGPDVEISDLIMEQTDRCKLVCYSSFGKQLLYAVFCDGHPILQTKDYIEALIRYREKAKEFETRTFCGR